MKKLLLPILLLVFILFSGFLLASNTLAQSSADCLKQYHNSQAKCSDAARACIDGCPGAQGVDLGPLGECIRACFKQEESCNAVAEAAYKICIEAVGQGQQTPAPTPAPQTPEETPEEEETEQFGLLNIFGVNPYQAWLNMKAWAETLAFFKSGEAVRFTESTILHAFGTEPTWEREEREIKAQEALYEQWWGKDWRKIVYPEPVLTTRDEQDAWGFLPPYIPGQENIAVVKGQAELETPDSKQFVTVTNTSAANTTVQYTFYNYDLKNSAKDSAQVRYSWDFDSGAVINLPQGTEIKFLEPVQDKQTQELKRMVKLNKGELEIKVKNAAKEKFGVQTDFLDLIVIGTHFWVRNDLDHKLTLVGVYAGKVEIKTKDGKIIRVSPKNGEPGVVAITQKLSPVKLAVLGLVLVAVTGGVVWVFKKRRFANLPAKRRR